MPPRNPAKQRSFLKWAGGKYEISDRIRSYLPVGKVLIEPFVGAGSIFLNTEYERYILNDINQDLINLYQTIQGNASEFIEDAKPLFSERNNTEDTYYSLRERFNTSNDPYERSIIFLYLNKFGYNGLCRYNKSGGFNVPFGRKKCPSFPQSHIEIFSEKSKKAKFVCEDFKKTFSRARESHVIYCDPPYSPLSDTSDFSDYSTEGFGPHDQERLADVARHTSNRGITVVISNHDTPFTRRIYKGAKIVPISVRRNISCKSENRNNAKEIIAIFKG
jgi:DNA adenine methylase